MADRLLSLRGFTLITTWPALASKSKEEFDDWLADCGLLWKTRSCPNCGNPCKLTKQGKKEEECVRWKFECCRRACRQPGIPHKFGYLKDTFFETLRGDRKKIFLASYLFAYDLGLVKEMARTLEVNERTIIQWTQWFRDVLVDYYTNNVKKIGGPNTVVQVDETCIVRRKYNVGRIVRKDWCRRNPGWDETSVCRDHGRSQLYISGCYHPEIRPTWRGHPHGQVEREGYNNLSNLGYQHETVNHCENFVDPTTGAHTQRIENFWGHLKAKIRSRHGLKGDLWDDHFFEVLWKWQFNSEDLLYELWKLIAAKYPIS
ncbi:hypothetical protein V3C99_001056 [Haemonchus contortus]